MTNTFIIEDETHAEWQGEYATFEDAILELKRRIKIPWDKKPNVCPCTSWKTCERNYEIIEFETTKKPWKEIKRIPVLKISSKGTKWLFKK